MIAPLLLIAYGLALASNFAGARAGICVLGGLLCLHGACARILNPGEEATDV